MIASESIPNDWRVFLDETLKISSKIETLSIALLVIWNWQLYRIFVGICEEYVRTKSQGLSPRKDFFLQFSVSDLINVENTITKNGLNDVLNAVLNDVNFLSLNSNPSPLPAQSVSVASHPSPTLQTQKDSSQSSSLPSSLAFQANNSSRLNVVQSTPLRQEDVTPLRSSTSDTENLEKVLRLKQQYFLEKQKSQSLNLQPSHKSMPSPLNATQLTEAQSKSQNNSPTTLQNQIQ